MEKPRTRSVLGVPLSVTDYDGAVATTRQWATTGDRAYAVGAAATHFVTLSRHDARFRKSLERFDLITPDGMPCVWVMNAKGERLKDRVYGPTLMLHALAQPGMRHFFLGGTPELLEKLSVNLRERFPDLIIAGSYAPPFPPWPEGESERMITAICESGANYIWVGLGCPKQENWIADHLDQLSPGVYFAIGAAFLFHSGEVKQAPRWMQRNGLEWLFRFASEPRRLWKRYVVYNSLFIYHATLELLLRRD